MKLIVLPVASVLNKKTLKRRQMINRAPKHLPSSGSMKMLLKYTEREIDRIVEKKIAQGHDFVAL